MELRRRYLSWMCSVSITFLIYEFCRHTICAIWNAWYTIIPTIPTSTWENMKAHRVHISMSILPTFWQILLTSNTGKTEISHVISWNPFDILLPIALDLGQQIHPKAAPFPLTHPINIFPEGNSICFNFEQLKNQ